MASIFSQQDLDQKLTIILCERLSVKHQQNCLAAAEVVSPSRAKQFWQALKANAEIYTILVGKIRLLDTADNLVTTLKSVSVFGEMTSPSGKAEGRRQRAEGNVMDYTLRICLLPYLAQNGSMRTYLFGTEGGNLLAPSRRAKRAYQNLLSSRLRQKQGVLARISCLQAGVPSALCLLNLCMCCRLLTLIRHVCLRACIKLG